MTEQLPVPKLLWNYVFANVKRDMNLYDVNVYV